jgi:hypothetical protein
MDVISFPLRRRTTFGLPFATQQTIANSPIYIGAVNPSSFHHITAVAQQLSAVKIKTYFLCYAKHVGS